MVKYQSRRLLSRRPKKEAGRRETATVLIFISCLFHLALIAIFPCLRPRYWLRNVPLILMFYLGPAVFQMYEKYEKFKAGYFSGASRPWFIRQGCNHRLATTQPSHQWWNHPESGVISRMIVVIEGNLSNCSKIYKKKMEIKKNDEQRSSNIFVFNAAISLLFIKY